MAVFTNAFRTDPRRAGHITRGGCLLGYAAILLAVPLVGTALAALTRLALSAAGDGGLAPPLAMAETYFAILSLSYLGSWIGALISIPLVLMARVHGLFGWAGAMLAATAIMVLITSGMMGATIEDALKNLGLPAATLGLAFWLAVRLANPRAFD